MVEMANLDILYSNILFKKKKYFLKNSFNDNLTDNCFVQLIGVF